VIVVATGDFELYHDLVAELRERDVEFTTVEPGDPLPERARVLITGDTDDVDAALETIVASTDDVRGAVDEALAVLRGGDGRTIVGIDPGPNPGIAVLSGDLVVAPGRGGGTNALVVRHPDFRTDYHGASYRDHLRAAHELGASVREFDSHRLATDVDEPADLAELLLHGDGRATDWLRDAGFELATTDGRVGVERHH